MKPGLCPDLPFYVNDWLSSPAVSAMTPAEEGAFIRLLCYAWNEPDCTLPDDDGRLATMSRLGDAWTAGSGAKLREKFTPCPDRPGRLFNPRLRVERSKQKARTEAATKQRRDAANKRWEGIRPQSDRNAAASIPQCGGNASSPVTPLSGGGKVSPPLPPTPRNAIAMEKELGEMKSILAELEADRTSWDTPEWTAKKQKAQNRRLTLLKSLGRLA